MPKSIIQYEADVLIIGAGPAGTLAAILLCQAGYSVCVFERSRFPRFSIGESLLPQAMDFLEKANVLPLIEKAGFQVKNGATFRCGEDKHATIDFSNKFTAGWDRTFEVQRANFDQILADYAKSQGVNICFNHSVTAYNEQENNVCLKGMVSDSDESYIAKGRFVFDASGPGRVLARLLNINEPSPFPVRKAIFTHIKDGITDRSFDREKILITVHPSDHNIWYWLIPFSDGTSSIGVVGETKTIDSYGKNDELRLTSLINSDPYYKKVFPQIEYIREIQAIESYSCKVKRLYGKKYALLGNAADFLDPIFSSGITIAFKSADLAVQLLCRTFSGENVNWQQEYTEQLGVGVQAFKSFVEAWYDQSLQKIIFNQPKNNSKIKQMITSLLAGYAWDISNPFVSRSKHFLKIVAAGCS